MKLDMVGLIVENMKEAISFYQLLGFQLLEGDETASYVELNNEGVRISLNKIEMITEVLGFKPEITGDKIELAFLCESKEEVNELVEKIRQNQFEIIQEPFLAPWKQYYALVRDADRNIISLFVNEN
ncbi:VOC family protein [Vagococcus carniphilus]|uniref:VOC family protein n=1 Tax=Vagococcus carniphilus TaxID=218144 RepID=UPI002891D711|nr:VOC family protein [Vagococcus carniphilus]MDT2814223.1 VOC family protein [Vagococcus carniphilus]MDT2864411.1 VOC family protein [Vagococcus carniphilus]